MSATLLIAAHGTRSARGSATSRELLSAVAAARPGVPAELCFLDVAAPSLASALDGLAPAAVLVVPLLLSAGYHVRTDIPSIASGRPGVRVARHLGPDPLVLDAVADRLAAARGDLAPASTLLAAVPSSEADARAEVSAATAALAGRLGRPVRLLPLSGSVTVDEFPAPVEVATYLLGAGDFLDGLRTAVGTHGVVAEPIGVHPSLVRLVWQRYDEALTQPAPSS